MKSALAAELVAGDRATPAEHVAASSKSRSKPNRAAGLRSNAKTSGTDGMEMIADAIAVAFVTSPALSGESRAGTRRRRRSAQPAERTAAAIGTANISRSSALSGRGLTTLAAKELAPSTARAPKRMPAETAANLRRGVGPRADNPVDVRNVEQAKARVLSTAPACADESAFSRSASSTTRADWSVRTTVAATDQTIGPAQVVPRSPNADWPQRSRRAGLAVVTSAAPAPPRRPRVLRTRARRPRSASRR